MQQQNRAPLAVERLGSLMGKYSVPCIISLLVGALYNIVDQIFIANADYLGSSDTRGNTSFGFPSAYCFTCSVRR